MLKKDANWIAVISEFELSRRGMSDILTNGGYDHVHDFRNSFELGDYLATHCHPDLVLLDTDKDYTAATAQFRKLDELLGFTKRIALVDDRTEIWVRLCRDHDFSLLLRRHVCPESFFQILERVSAGEHILPKAHAPSLVTENVQNRRKPRLNLAKQSPRPIHQICAIPCLVCRKHFETEDRKANRICPKCKSKSSWRYGTSEHAVQI